MARRAQSDRRLAIAVALVAGLLTAGPAAGERAALGGERPAADRLEYRDGERPVWARRLAPPPQPGAPAAVALSYPSLGVEVQAEVDAWAIVQLDRTTPDPRAALTGLGLVPDQPLMPSAGLWRVRDAGGGDGLDIAARLVPHLGEGGPLRQAVPDLHLAHRPAGRRETPPDDPRYAGQWYLQRITIEDAWALSDGDPSVTVVVVDNGCDLAHPDLAAKLDPGLDVVDGDDDPTYVRGARGAEHGTACAGLVAATTDNGVGIAGACPACRLRCVRLLSDGARPTPISADVRAFQFALEVDAAVVSNSWGFTDPIPVPAPLATAIEEVYDAGRGGLGALVLFAAGNEDREVAPFELLGVRGVIGVGALNVFDEATVFTNRGEPVDLSAPAGTITTDISGPDGADPGDYTTAFGGTSSAAPVAAGVAGLLVAAAPERTAADLSQILIETTRPAPYAAPDERGHDPVYGHGIIDPAAALRRAMGLDEVTPDAGPAEDAAPADAAADASPPDMATTDGAPPPAADGPRGSDGCATAGPARGDTRGAVPLVLLLLLLPLTRAGRTAPGSRRDPPPRSWPARTSTRPPAGAAPPPAPRSAAAARGRR